MSPVRYVGLIAFVIAAAALTVGLAAYVAGYDVMGATGAIVIVALAAALALRLAARRS